MELWESHAYVLEPCGGCPPGFECKEEPIRCASSVQVLTVAVQSFNAVVSLLERPFAKHSMTWSDSRSCKTGNSRGSTFYSLTRHYGSWMRFTFGWLWTLSSLPGTRMTYRSSSPQEEAKMVDRLHREAEFWTFSTESSGSEVWGLFKVFLRYILMS